jgi:hypothetical protein
MCIDRVLVGFVGGFARDLGFGAGFEIVFSPTLGDMST